MRGSGRFLLLEENSRKGRDGERMGDMVKFTCATSEKLWYNNL